MYTVHNMPVHITVGVVASVYTWEKLMFKSEKSCCDLFVRASALDLIHKLALLISDKRVRDKTKWRIKWKIKFLVGEFLNSNAKNML